MPYDPSQDDEFLDFLVSVENPRLKGLDKKTNRLKAFKVKGRDEWNVGYGHKIDGPDSYVVIGGKQIFVGPDDPGITPEQARALKKQDVRKAYRKAKVEFNNFNPYRDGTDWDSLSQAEQALFTEITYNVGTLRNKETGKFGWPKLSKSLYSYRSDPSQIDTILSEMERAGLTDRNKKLKKFFEPRFKSIKSVKPSDLLERIKSRMKEETTSRKGDLSTIMRSLLDRISMADEEEARNAQQQEELQPPEQEEQDKQDLKLDAGIYERPDGSLFQISDTMEVIELRGATNGESQASK